LLIVCCADDVEGLLLCCSIGYVGQTRVLNKQAVQEACKFLKELTCYSYDNVMLAMTGSSFTTLWMDKFGADITDDIMRVTLPSVHHDRTAIKWLLDTLLSQEEQKVQSGTDAGCLLCIQKVVTCWFTQASKGVRTFAGCAGLLHRVVKTCLSRSVKGSCYQGCAECW
jgi:hypothetical protein